MEKLSGVEKIVEVVSMDMRVAHVEQDGTIKISLPESVVKMWHLGPSSCVFYTSKPDGEILVTLHSSLNGLS